MIIADTAAIIALVDRNDRHHRVLRRQFEIRPEEWLVPWAVLPEVDYLLAAHVGRRAQTAFLADLADGSYQVEWGRDADLEDAARLNRQYAALGIGLVDAVVMAIAARRRATAIATLDIRHFGAVNLLGSPKLLPRDI